MPTFYDEIQFGNDYDQFLQSVENDELLPQEEKSQLLTAIKNLQAVIKDKTRKVGEMQTIERVIDEDSKNDLLQSYALLGQALSACRQKVQGTSSTTELLDQLDKASQSESFALQNYDPSASYQTLNSIFESNTILHVDLTGQKTGIVSGAQSARLPFVYTAPDGTVYNGFFTETKSMNPFIDYKAKEVSFLKKYGEAGKTCVRVFEDFLQDMERRQKELIETGKPTVQKTKDELAALFIDRLGSLNSFSLFFANSLVKLDPEHYYYENGKDKLGTPGDGKINISDDNQLIDAIADYGQIFAVLSQIHDLHKKAGIDIGQRLDSRNAALSSLAGFMGKSHIVAKSIPMTVTVNGKTVHGTFMATAKGVDVNNAKSTDDIYHAKNVDKSSGLASMSDLQALDYICGNIDRHAANFLYQFSDRTDHSKCTNVVGIDNDLSFGTFVESKAGRKGTYSTYVKDGKLVKVSSSEKPVPDKFGRGINQMQHPDTMVCITKSMSERILSLTETSLRQTLSPFGLSEDQILACWKRTEVFQNRIRSAVTVPENTKQKAFESGKLYIIHDEDFTLYTARELARPSPARAIYAFTSELDKQYLEKDRTIAHVLKSEQPFDAVAMRTRSAEASRIIFDMEEKTKDGKTSKEYENLKKAVKDYRDFCNEHLKGKLFEQDVYTHDGLLRNIQKSAVAYQKHHDRKLFKSDYAKDRKAYVDTVLSYAKEHRLFTKDAAKNQELLNAVRENEEKVINAMNAEGKAKATQLVLYGAMESSLAGLDSSLQNYEKASDTEKAHNIQPVKDALIQSMMIKEFMSSYGEGKLTLNTADTAIAAIKKMNEPETIEKFKATKVYKEMFKDFSFDKVQQYLANEKSEFAKKAEAVTGIKKSVETKGSNKKGPEDTNKKKTKTATKKNNIMIN